MDGLSNTQGLVDAISNVQVPQVLPQVNQQAAQPQSWMQQNPNQLAIALDLAGQMFDPKNPLAGVGSNLAQGNIMAEARKKQQEERSTWQNMMAGVMGGQMPISPVGQTGASGYSVKPSADGLTQEATITGTVPQPGIKTPENLSLGGMMGNPDPNF